MGAPRGNKNAAGPHNYPGRRRSGGSSKKRSGKRNGKLTGRQKALVGALLAANYAGRRGLGQTHKRAAANTAVGFTADALWRNKAQQRLGLTPTPNGSKNNKKKGAVKKSLLQSLSRLGVAVAAIAIGANLHRGVTRPAYRHRRLPNYQGIRPF